MSEEWLSRTFVPESASSGWKTSAETKRSKETKDNEEKQGILAGQEEAAAAAAIVSEREKEETIKAARVALFMQPTSGFGPNTNLARSFLTTL